MNSILRDSWQPFIATLDGADDQGMIAARNGGVLRLESGVVHALAGAPRRRIGHVWSSEIVHHLAAGGQAYFRSDDDYAARQIVCGLVQ
ncbi:hypothetical protein GCM10007242_16790 [Pigmentiphaga litoralis]|uniref:hypothetical protein n=1 Tax=Pigmentiphaga litoralis TaxID=516702 RepID=UPI00167A57B4|nr:hypothetical protein [Pigmentiphaga litoralis]GGX11328.1 hypothetical protein GCM10007242_16790 [Pigmentiphaga litoralis]